MLPGILTKLQQQLSKSPCNPNRQTAAKTIITYYFRFFHPQDINEELWQLTTGTISNELLHDTQTGADRLNHIFFYEYTKLFMEAVHCLHGPPMPTKTKQIHKHKKRK